MQRFAYKYQGTIHESYVEYYMECGSDRYKVSLGDGFSIVITQAGMRSAGNKIIWVQSHLPDDIVYAHDLIQAIGEGLERTKINFTR